MSASFFSPGSDGRLSKTSHAVNDAVRPHQYIKSRAKKLGRGVTALKVQYMKTPTGKLCSVAYLFTVSESPITVKDLFGRVMATVDPKLIFSSCLKSFMRASLCMNLGAQEKSKAQLRLAKMTYRSAVSFRPRNPPHPRSYFVPSSQ